MACCVDLFLAERPIQRKLLKSQEITMVNSENHIGNYLQMAQFVNSR